MNTTTRFSYDRDKITAGILHFGVGNFHRAHLESYANALLSDPTQSSWGISGAMIMPQDESLYRRLKSQDGAYSLTVCSRTGGSEREWIGSLVELMWSGEGVEPIIERVADPNIKIISLTITEGGYTLSSDIVKEDIENPKSPKSIFGIVAEGLRRRRERGVGGLTILSCDNLQHNGDVCRQTFWEFFSAQDESLARWSEECVTYPNSMVDRITPATTPEDVKRLNEGVLYEDAAPVYCEDYIEWVVEDNFVAGRPEWERAGVEFTQDVAPYEVMKLSLLNASHTLLSYPSFLGGHRKVDEAMHDDRIVAFVSAFMDRDVTPYVPSPSGRNLEQYKRILIERFANSAVSDQVSRLCGDGASKFPVYVVPIMVQMLANEDDMTRIAYLMAAYRHYLKYKKDDNGDSFEIFEPKITAEDLGIIATDDPVSFLSITPFRDVDLLKSWLFEAKYVEFAERIKEEGAMAVLESIIR